MEKLEAGEVYLTVKLIGHEFVTAFKNKNKQSDNQPDFKGDGIAIWIKTKKETPELAKTETIAKTENVA
jgi:hypothetical protein